MHPVASSGLLLITLHKVGQLLLYKGDALSPIIVVYLFFPFLHTYIDNSVGTASYARPTAFGTDGGIVFPHFPALCLPAPWVSLCIHMLSNLFVIIHFS